MKGYLAALFLLCVLDASAPTAEFSYTTSDGTFALTKGESALSGIFWMPGENGQSAQAG